MEKNTTSIARQSTQEEEKKVGGGSSGDSINGIIGNSNSSSSGGKWEPLNYKSANEYTTKNITNRWETQRDAWLNTSRDTKQKEPDVRGSTQSKPVPLDQYDPERKALKKTMKAVQGPYPRFNNYYPLEEIIDLYMEIWYDSDSDSDDE